MDQPRDEDAPVFDTAEPSAVDIDAPDWPLPEEPAGDDLVDYGGEYDDWSDLPPVADTGEFAAPPPAPDRLAHYPSAAIVPKDTQRSRWPLLLGAFAAAFVGALAAVGILVAFGFVETSSPTTTVAATPTTVIERVTTNIVTQEVPAETAAAVAEKVIPSIVTVDVQRLVNGECQSFGSGSGVVIDVSGRIATNEHVVDGADCVQVVFQDGRIYDARILGVDPLTDVGLLQIEAAFLEPIDLGTTDDLAIGDTTVAVGNPLGQEGGASLTVGVLSATDRQVNFGDGSALFGMLQTDAPITQGSSGGALVDAAGRLVGITSAIGVSDAGAEGIGYAIPIELVLRVIDEILEKGAVHHAFLGIEGDTFYEILEDGAEAPAGAVVRNVVADTSATAIGLQEGDVIISVNGTEITTMDDLIIALRLYRAGEEAEFRVIRGEETLTWTIELGERPEDAG